MKKKIVWLICSIIVLTLISCNRNEGRFRIEDLNVNLSVYNLVNEDIINDDKNTVLSINNTPLKSKTYQRLLKDILYIENLLTAYKSLMNEAIDNHDINLRETYVYNGYEYNVTRRNNLTYLTINNGSTFRKLTLNIEENDDGSKNYYGSHQVVYDTFNFNYIDGKSLDVEFIQKNVNKISRASITKDGEMTLVHIRYDRGSVGYDLYSVITPELTGLYYFSDKLNGSYRNEQIEVIDIHGDILYEAASFNLGTYKYSGWLLNALNPQNVSHEKNDTFLVDNNKFINKPGMVNLYEVSLYDNQIYLLGELEYKGNALIKPREPFSTTYYDQVDKMTRRIKEFYEEIN